MIGMYVLQVEYKYDDDTCHYSSDVQSISIFEILTEPDHNVSYCVDVDSRELKNVLLLNTGRYKLYYGHLPEMRGIATKIKQAGWKN